MGTQPFGRQRLLLEFDTRDRAIHERRELGEIFVDGFDC